MARISNHNSFLFLCRAEENDSNTLPVFDDLLTRNGKTVTFSSLNCKSLSPEFPRRRFSLVLEASLVNDEAVRQDDDEEHEVFNDAFLQDLKDGICRLPNENHAQRASCPPVAKRPDSPIHVEKVSDKQVLIPPEKPKRKGQVCCFMIKSILIDKYIIFLKETVQ